MRMNEDTYRLSVIGIVAGLWAVFSLMGAAHASPCPPMTVYDPRLGRCVADPYGRRRMQEMPPRPTTGDERSAANIVNAALRGLDCGQASHSLRRLANQVLQLQAAGTRPAPPPRPGSNTGEEIRRRWREHVQSPQFWRKVWDRMADAYRSCNRQCFDDGISMGTLSATAYCSASIALSGLPGPGYIAQPPLPVCETSIFTGCVKSYGTTAAGTAGCSPYTTGSFEGIFAEYQSQDCHLGGFRSEQNFMSECNFDGLVGPTHHYAGLSFGNVASTRNAKLASQPKKAALQGLAKAARLRDLGLKQGILPPLRRPRLDTLRALGFTGTDVSVIERAFKSVPQLVSAAYSASSMWVANSATFSPSLDAEDGRAHFTVANLASKFHRSLEPKQTGVNFRRIFGGETFLHHDPVLAQFGDEGAANHMRLAPSHGAKGLELFVYGGSVLQESLFIKPKKFPARQSIEAVHAISSTHGLAAKGSLFLQQNPDAIDAGVFHNDVVAVANENVLFVHENAYADQKATLERIQQAYEELPGSSKAELIIIEVPESEVTLEEAIRSYLFNSQLVTLSPGKMALICPEECRESTSVRAAIDWVIADKNPIQEVHYFDVRESMQNGGGPACLRLRVSLNSVEESEVHPGVWLTPEREASLTAWINKHYRDRILFDDLRDAKLFLEANAAMDELETILSMPLA